MSIAARLSAVVVALLAIGIASTSSGRAEGYNCTNAGQVTGWEFEQYYPLSNEFFMHDGRTRLFRVILSPHCNIRTADAVTLPVQLCIGSILWLTDQGGQDVECAVTSYMTCAMAPGAC